MKIVNAVTIETNRSGARPQPGTARHDRAQLGRTVQDSEESARTRQSVAGQGSTRHRC